VSEQKKEEFDWIIEGRTITAWKKLEILEGSLQRWSTFSLSVADSPGPLYTAGVHAILGVVRSEATTLLESVASIKEDYKALEDHIDSLEDMLAEACWRC